MYQEELLKHQLNQKFGEKRCDGFYVEYDLTQEELAQLVGASGKTVNKTLADFAQRNWIGLLPRAVLLIKVEKLKEKSRQVQCLPHVDIL